MNTLDSRDLKDRLEELENELEALIEELEDAEEELATYDGGDDEDLGELQEEVNLAKDALKGWKDENQEELDALIALKDYCDGYGWDLGLTFIAEEDFEEYAEDLASDLYGEEIRNASWPFDCIDWEKAADALRQDYSSIDYQGTKYLFRS